MASINIPSTVDDPNYRYKMPRVRAKIEGRGNGIKTNIMNMGDIARALKRPPEYPTRFCGCELGSASKFELAEGKAIVNGAHTEPDIQVVIDKFIDRFVLCPNCRLPEIDLRVHKGRVQGKCNACGFSGDMDNAHKVGTYIVKNPPDAGNSTMGAKKKTGSSGCSSKRTKEERQRGRAERALRKGGLESGGGERDPLDEAGSGVESNDEAAAAAAAEKKARRKAEKKAEKKAAEKKKKKKAAAADKDKLSAVTSLNFDSPEIAQVITRLDDFLHRAEKPLPKDFFQEVRLLQVAQDFNAVLRVYVALCALFPRTDSNVEDAGGAEEGFNINLFHTQLPYLASVCDRSIDGETILAALETFVQRLHPQMFRNGNGYARMCSELYNADLIDEEAFISRYGEERSPTSTASDPAAAASEPSDPALTFARGCAANFIRWLEAAESASASENEGEHSAVDADDDSDDEEGALAAAALDLQI